MCRRHVAYESKLKHGRLVFLFELSHKKRPLNLEYNHWQRIFLLSLGLFLGAAFCMKWMENDLRVNNEKFTVIGLELFYSKQKVADILASVDERVRTILRYHLFFDFAFMTGAYPGIASLCMMAGKRINSFQLKEVLYAFAALQLLAWIADILENFWLLKWMEQPSIGSEFTWYHRVVVIKWILALSGVVTGVFFMIRKKQNL